MVVPLLALVLASACAARVPRVAYGPLAGGLDEFLAAHPLAAGQDIRIDEIGRTATMSYHLAQVRAAERPHRHASHDLTVFALRGRGTLTLGERRVPFVAGDAAVIARGEAHWFAPDGSDVAVTLVAFAPPLDAPDNVPVDRR
jgi:mannose-6-phosphate isomerase-like protein (cupin superfamily)